MTAGVLALQEHQMVEQEGEEHSKPAPQAAEIPGLEYGAIWEVVGGDGRGGIVVRDGPDLESQKKQARLSRFALVRVQDFQNGRVQYELLSGTGPSSGWVLLHLEGKRMIVPAGPGVTGGEEGYSRERLEQLLKEAAKAKEEEARAKEEPPAAEALGNEDGEGTGQPDGDEVGVCCAQQQQDSADEAGPGDRAEQPAPAEVGRVDTKGRGFCYAVGLNSNKREGQYCAAGSFDIRDEACERAARLPQIWEVVGGDEKSGIIVKKGLEIGSEKEEEKLSKGARLVQLELVGERLRFQRLSGTGPLSGWITTKLQHKDLAIPVVVQGSDARNFRHGCVLSDRSGRDYAVVGVRPWQGLPRLWFQPLDLDKPRACCFESNPMAFLHPKPTPEAVAVGRGKKVWEVTGSDEGSDGVLVHTRQQRTSEEEDVRLAVGSRVEQATLKGERLQYRLLSGSGPPTGWVSIRSPQRKELLARVPAAAVQGASVKPIPVQEQSFADFDLAEDSDGEEMHLCHHCRLPLGRYMYKNETDERQEVLHPECGARVLAQREAACQREEAELKLAHRAEYGIGWKVERIPRNVSLAGRLKCETVPRGMCCLVLDEESSSIRLAATVEPSAAVNLAYLSTALRVRHEDGREPFFSLDPAGTDGTMQTKRFEPDWLGGTSLGEVMFQADYYMKELSLGEAQQPVVGMKSCFDYLEEGFDLKRWYARLWYYVQRADMYISEDNVLVPSVKMGVEAREQDMGENGLEDTRVTRPDHPLVRFAQEFTGNFDLIAERKSVVFQLREVAKSALLAKFLLEFRLRLGSEATSVTSWLDLVDRGAADAGSLRIPQLWNEHRKTKIQVQNGKLKVKGWDAKGQARRLYGGVEFGLEQARAQVPQAQFRGMVAGPKPPEILLSPKPVPTSVERGILRQIREEGTAFGAVSPFSMGLVRTRTIMAMKTDPDLLQPNLKGVDLSMDNFDVSHIVEISGRLARDPRPEAAKHEPLGSLFWSWIGEDAGGKLAHSDASLFRDVFTPQLSDRRAEGEDFVPPETGRCHLVQLRNLVEKEASVRHERYWHFMSKDFNENNPGALFPSSWRPLGECPARERGPMESIAVSVAKANKGLSKALECATPVFHKCTEDGIHFRIYIFTNIEVRTLQWPDAEEFIGVVYVIGMYNVTDKLRFCSDPLAFLQVQGNAAEEAAAEQVVKVTEYVEHAPNALGQHFVILETKRGSMILTEQLADGRTTWEVAPVVLEDRRTSPKTLRSKSVEGVCVTELLALKNKLDRPRTSPSPCERKSYARSIYSKAPRAP